MFCKKRTAYCLQNGRPLFSCAQFAYKFQKHKFFCLQSYSFGRRRESFQEREHEEHAPGNTHLHVLHALGTYIRNTEETCHCGTQRNIERIKELLHGGRFVHHSNWTYLSP